MFVYSFIYCIYLFIYLFICIYYSYEFIDSNFSVPNSTITFVFVDAIEIMKFLVHQLITLDNQEAHQMFYGLFVNTKGNISHVAADDEMEGMVGVTKPNITSKTKPGHWRGGGIKLITEQYDMTTNTITRARKHTTASSCKDDEASMLKDLRKVRPFDKSPVRANIHVRY